MPFWASAAWLGPSELGRALAGVDHTSAAAWSVMDSSDTNALRRFPLVVNALALHEPGALTAVAAALGECHGTVVRRIVTIAPLAALGSGADPTNGAWAAFAVALSRGLAERYADLSITANTILVPEAVAVADLAYALAFFADPANDYVTGQTLRIDGGALLDTNLSA